MSKTLRPDATPEKAKPAALRGLPAVGVLVQEWRRASKPAQAAEPELLTHLARGVIQEARARSLATGDSPSEKMSAFVAAADEALARWRADSSTCRVVNGTGIILHSGLGRAVLPTEVARALARLDGYSLLEVDRAEGSRR